ncbi:MAG: precorrin-8X methylmutase [Ferrimicrobium sp.]
MAAATLGYDMPAATVSPIERESFAIIQREADLSRFGPLGAEVAARIIHATGDIAIAADLVLDDAAISAAITALDSNAPIITDVTMVAAGVPGLPLIAAIDHPDSHLAPIDNRYVTRSARGMSATLAMVGKGALIVVGSAPTALDAALDLASEYPPACILGFPVGFVGAAESKARLLDSPILALTCKGRRGGSPMAAAALNALRYLARGECRLG